MKNWKNVNKSQYWKLCEFSSFSPFVSSLIWFLMSICSFRSHHQNKANRVQERDSNITFVTNFSCWSVWKREILMKIGSRWTRNCKNESSQKIMIFFIFFLYINEKWKKLDFLACPSSFLVKKHWKIMIFGILWLQKMQRS